MIQCSWFVVYYSMLWPDNLLDTTMTAIRLLIIFMRIIHELMRDQQKRRPHMHTAVHAVSVKSQLVSAMWCVWKPHSWYTPNIQLNVFFPWYVLMHKGDDKLNLNLNIAGLVLQETYTGTDTSWASTRVSSHVHYTGLGLGGLVETKWTKWRGARRSRCSESDIELRVGLLCFTRYYTSVV